MIIKLNYRNMGMSKLKDKYKQFGMAGCCKRIIKSTLRILFGIEYGKYYYLVNDIDYQNQREIFEKKRGIWEIKKLQYDDFLHGVPSVFTEKKLRKIKYRFEQSGDYEAYGIVVNDRLIYSCWLSFKDSHVTDKLNCPLPDNECFMFDAYCDPEFRGKGLHGMMNAYRLMKGYERGKTRCAVIVLHENIPALKSQLRVGYRIAFTYYVLNVRNKSFTNFLLKKDKYL